MFRTRTSSPPPPNHLRRRYHTVNQWQEDEGVRLSTQDFGPSGQASLDLSIHHPSHSFGNRFDVLQPRSPQLKRNSDPYVPPYRRYRQTRGSKEAKRRRDARRNRRKLHAAQMLDEELSRGFDRTLQQANIHRPQHYSIASPTLVLPTTTLPAPKPVHIPPTPPQLPYFNFGGLDLLGDIPLLTSSSSHPTSLPSPPMTPLLPSWCPALPSFSTNNTKWGDFPLFFDLSKPDLKAQEMQLGRPLISPQPRKQSRFFPPPTSSKPTVRLPPASCQLHAADEGVQDASPAKPKTLVESVELAVKAAEAAHRSTCTDQSEASAANLWRILTTSERGDDNDLYPRDCAYQPANNVFAAPYGPYDHRLEAVGAPVELDGIELPYVHANSLTGYANELGGEKSTEVEDDTVIFNPPATMLPVQDIPIWLNELLVDPNSDEVYADALLAVLNMPQSPSTLEPQDSAIGMPGSSPVGSASDNTEQDLAFSDAHFQSEQALFGLPSPTTKAADEDLVDVATFLTMVHSTSCWCNDCGEPPELINIETLMEDDGWMVYSSVDETYSPSVSSAWEWEWGAIVTDDEKEVVRRQCSTRPDWDDSFPCTPSSVAHGAW